MVNTTCTALTVKLHRKCCTIKACVFLQTPSTGTQYLVPMASLVGHFVRRYSLLCAVEVAQCAVDEHLMHRATVGGYNTCTLPVAKTVKNMMTVRYLAILPVYHEEICAPRDNMQRKCLPVELKLGASQSKIFCISCL